MGLLALLGILGQVFFVVVVALLPFFQPGYSPVHDPISRLLLGPYGFVQSCAFLAAGVGSLALAVGIRRTTRGSRGSLSGPVLIGLYGVGAALAGVVFTDAGGAPAYPALLLHAVAAGLIFVFGPAGILFLSGLFARDGRWSSFYPVSLALGFAALVGLADMLTVQVGLANLVEAVGPVARRFEGFGIVQRVFVGTLILWMMLAALRLRSIAKERAVHPPE